MNWYEYSQNNSGGSFKTSDTLDKWVFIEARTEEKSKEKAFKLDIYFDGVEDGSDCACCGDRWSSPDELVFPYRYGTFDKKEAEKIAEEFGADMGKTVWKYAGTSEPDPEKYDIIFRDVESYAKFLTIRHGWNENGAILHYANGKVVKIGAEKKKKNNP